MTSRQPAGGDRIPPRVSAASSCAGPHSGRRLLRLIQKTSHVPVVTKAADFLPARSLVAPVRLSPAQAMLALDLRATALASLASSGLDAPRPNDDYLRSPVYLRET